MPRGKPIQKGQVLNPNGRTPGTKNKFPSALKEKVLHAAARLEAEGKDLGACASADPNWFWENFVKPMLPKDINVLNEVTLQVTINKGGKK